MKLLTFTFILLAPGWRLALAQSPAPLTLAECYALAEKNYPLIKQRELIAQTSAYTIENIGRGYWPQLNVSGQASYQSAVTQIPIKIPGVDIPSLSKDQYKLYGEINQTLYDGGAIKQQKQLQQAAEAVQQRQLQTELYQLKSRINQLFFGVLLLDAQLKQASLLDSNIRLGLNKVQAAVANGTALRSSAEVLRADLLKNKQRSIELRTARKSYLLLLRTFTGRPVDEGTTLVRPLPAAGSMQISRPELGVFEARSKSLDAQQQLLSARARPRVGVFLQGGAGRPALNFLSNSFEPYYIGGLCLSWSPSVLYTLKKEKALIEINRKTADVEKETFLFNTTLEATRDNTEIGKYRELLSSDDEIIELRSRIKTSSLAQLENGVINSSDYLREVNAEDLARQDKILHEIQLLTATYNLGTTTGNE